MKVFTDTNYREHGAGDLVEYLDKERGLENRFGEPMSDEEIEAFVEKSEAYEFEREIVISPEHGEDLSDAKFSLYTRHVMSEFCKDRPTATYCYAIHRDTDNPHAHVALTGTKRDLWMDTEDCEQLRERATEQFHDEHRALTEGLAHQLEQEWSVASERDHEPEPDHGEGVARDHDSPRDQEPAQGPDS
jgi:hypothetical protein